MDQFLNGLIDPLPEPLKTPKHLEELVPLKTRRHRLTEEEIPEVALGLILRLKQLNEKREQLEQATIVMNCLRRLIKPKPGRPKTSSITWDVVDYYANDSEGHLMELLERA